MENIKQINIKNRTYYFFNDMINIKTFDQNILKIYTKTLIFITLNISQSRILVIMKIFIV